MMRARRLALAVLGSVCVAVLVAVPAAALAEGSCPNEQLRAEDHSTDLPDCRSYELVTPPFKFGQPLSRVGAPTADGTRLTFASIGAFAQPGSVRGIEGGVYVGSRGPEGWSTSAVNPSIGEFRGGGGVTDFSEDLTKTLFYFAPVSVPPIEQHASVQSIGGPPVDVGPVFEPAKAAAFTQADAEESNIAIIGAAGATANFSHVFFTIFNRGSINWHWEGDTTFQRGISLYEYTEVNNSEPTLVGVRGGLHSKELVSQCGTLLGDARNARSENVYNAISQSGATVFFTALAARPGCEEGMVHPAVNELYARIDGAETVAISAPTIGPGGDCEGCDETEPKPAQFQGASRDGSKVLFLSEQSLTHGLGAREPAEDNLYLFDFGAPAGKKVSLIAPRMAASSGEQGGVVEASEDGTRIYLVSEDTELAVNRDEHGKTAKETAEGGGGTKDLYMYNTQSRRFVFIAALSESDSQDWTASGVRFASATSDGRFLLFKSHNDLTTDASGAGNQLYRYDARAGEASAESEEAGAGVSGVPLMRVSIGQQASPGYFCSTSGKVEAGFNCNGNLARESIAPVSIFGGSANAGPQARAMSEDGSMVFFQSSAALTPRALDEACALEVGGSCESLAQNVYEWKQAGTGSCPIGQPAGCIYLISDGQDIHAASQQSAVNLIGTSASGDDVFFTTADSLVGQDTDGQQDIYDARVDGGLPAPAAPAGCQGEACHGAANAPPAFSMPGSLTLSGIGNLTPDSRVAEQQSKPRTLSGAQKLSKALKACKKKKSKKKRSTCEKRARRTYARSK